MCRSCTVFTKESPFFFFNFAGDSGLSIFNRFDRIPPGSYTLPAIPQRPSFPSPPPLDPALFWSVGDA